VSHRRCCAVCAAISRERDRLIRRLLAYGVSRATAARYLGVSRATVYRAALSASSVDRGARPRPCPNLYRRCKV